MPHDFKHRATTSGNEKKGPCRCNLWFFAGVLLGLFTAGLIWLKVNPALDGNTPRVSHHTPPPKPRPAEQAPKPRFTFYDVLPEMEVVIPREELKAPPKPKRAAAPKTPPKGNKSAARGVRFVLQLGAFRNAADAERLRAKAALVGVETEVQRISINGKNRYHRVRSKAYDRAEADRLYARLIRNGIKPLVVKLK